MKHWFSQLDKILDEHVQKKSKELNTMSHPQ